MNHVYLTESVIEKALQDNAITLEEAVRLKKKVACQVSIYKAINK